MRFRKSFSITKGVKLNLSKTGASVTVGKGPVSFNLGNKGAYVNWSVPGTGVYDRVRVDKLIVEKLGLDKLGFGQKKDEGDSKPAKSAKSSGKAKAEAAKKGPARPSDEVLERIEQEQVFFSMHTFAPDVEKQTVPELLDEVTAEEGIAQWLQGAQAPVPFELQAQAVADRRAVMIDLDLPEIEDMPSDKLVEMANGDIKVKAKTQKEQREDYRTCVFGLGEYVAANVLAIVPQAERVLLSAYTQRRNEKTGDVNDVYIYSVLFERAKFASGYQKKDPYEFCGKFKSRFYVLSSGVMKEIDPYGAEDI